ncbi:hypothetical protein E4U22_008002 [Claviceps purpurea]|nr:hypothetical protein E4U22_008002 [Claviceps purpurea]
MLDVLRSSSSLNVSVLGAGESENRLWLDSVQSNIVPVNGRNTDQTECQVEIAIAETSCGAIDQARLPSSNTPFFHI